MLNNLATAYAAGGRHREASEALKRAIGLKPDFVVAQYNLGLVYLLANKRDSALEQFQMLKTLHSQTADKLYAEIYRGKLVRAQVPLTTSETIPQ